MNVLRILFKYVFHDVTLKPRAKKKYGLLFQPSSLTFIDDLFLGFLRFVTTDILLYKKGSKFHLIILSF